MKKIIFISVLCAFISCTNDHLGDVREGEAKKKPSATLRATPECMSGYTITGVKTATRQVTFSWDTSMAAYNSNTTSKIEYYYFTGSTPCFGKSSPLLTFSLPNIFAGSGIGSSMLNLTSTAAQSIRWRFVNSGYLENNDPCFTATDWQCLVVY